MCYVYRVLGLTLLHVDVDHHALAWQSIVRTERVNTDGSPSSAQLEKDAQ